MLTDLHAMCLRDAFIKLLGKPTEGTMAYVRSLPTDVMRQLCVGELLQVPGWEIYYVSDEDAPEQRAITADRAVDIREEKRGSVLLLVDTKSAGAGMDGIYSAVREISEGELLPRATEIASKKLQLISRNFAQNALRQASRIGKANAISPWREFDFYVQCAAQPELIGIHISLLGLWGIAVGEVLRKEDLAISAQIVERLLLPASAENTVQARVESLLLPADATEQAAELQRFLRETSGLRWTDAAIRASEHPNLLFNALKPGFINQELKSIELLQWRANPNANPYSWSGLKPGDENVPVFPINEASKFEIRWKVLPSNIKAGSVEYKVSIVTGSDSELVSRQITHTGKEKEKCVFTYEDFLELDEGGKWEAKVRVHPVGEESPANTSYPTDSPRWKETEEFILTFGEPEATAKSSVGKKARALVEEAIKLSPEEFEIACRTPVTEDAQGHISYRANGKSGRVYRPPLIKTIEEDWKQRGFQVGRWVVRVRTEGSRASEPDFIPVERGNCEADVWRKLEENTRQMGQRTADRAGFIGMIHHGTDAAVANYVNNWATALDSGDPQLALANTIEVQTLSGNTIGLIVLPSHPIRVAWHSAYDELAYYARFDEKEKLRAPEVINALKTIDGSYVPVFLPGFHPNSSFVFGDTLGFYAVAMIRDDEPEPQATIAQMVRCLASVSEDAAPTVGITTASAIAREVAKYTLLHPQYGSLHINALRPGDGQTIAQALGITLKSKTEDDGEISPAQFKPGYILDLFPSAESNNTRLVGRYLSETAERRRAGVGGVGAISADDRWMLETYEVEGIALPRLKWAKRSVSEPTAPAHLSVAFDSFDSSVVPISEDTFGEARPIEAFGLIPSIVRRFTLDPVPTWTTTIAPLVEGEKHPTARSFSERLQKIQSAIARATAANLSNGMSNRATWAVIETRLKAEQLDFVRRLHELSDWVITVDRNAGIEYFDAPHDAAEVYETYVIDCVPERQDLDCLQLITSTSKIDEVLQLLESSLNDMALSCSPRNGRFLLSQLKAISGRLAMRLADRGQGRSEMIALAMFYARCASAGSESNNEEWFSLERGFIVPLDDVRDLLIGERREKAATETTPDEEPDVSGMLRADLVYVDLSKRGALQFTFVEIKYRRLIKSARDIKLHEYMHEQTLATRKRWIDTYFSNKLTQTQLALRRKRLARALHFYLDKAGRHLLNPQEHKRLSAAVDKLFRSETDVAPDLIADRGFIFCPEHTSGTEYIATDTRTQIYIFGPQGLPDVLPPAPGQDESEQGPPPAKEFEETAVTQIHNSASDTPDTGKESAGSGIQRSSNQDSINSLASVPENKNQVSKPVPHPSLELALHLGETIAGETPVKWNMSITGNPHLMIVGLPGMGKTTCIVNLCEQLIEGGVAPLIFSYHDDIETKLGERTSELNFTDIEHGLGFNPLRVVTKQSHAWLDNVGRLRDIFAAIYPDLGDIQLNDIREAVKQSYVELGYGSAEQTDNLPVPEFGRFFEILKDKPKPNPGVLARLNELNDYGFFNAKAPRSSMLDLHQPTIIRLHATQNDALQKAMASFVLLNIYQSMLLRGAQAGLTHAVIFDEAHRASRLKLLPTMAKESRKFGLAMIVASQEAKDFSDSLYAAIANYLALRVTETDAKALAKNVAQSTEASSIAGRLKGLAKYTAMFFCEGKRPTILQLAK